MKSKEINDFLDDMATRLFGTERKWGQCVVCGSQVNFDDFKDEASKKEYEISYMCQGCQDAMFSKGETDDLPLV